MSFSKNKLSEIFTPFKNLFGNNKDKPGISKEECIRLLKIAPERFEEFEKKYQMAVIQEDNEVQTKHSADTKLTDTSDVLRDIIDRIVTGCLLQTDPSLVSDTSLFKPVELDEIYALPKELRPQFTERYTTKDCNGDNYKEILWFYNKSLSETNIKKAKEHYDRFRIGLDLLDLDWVMYEMIDRNPNSIGYWFPKLKETAAGQDFFKLPETVIRKIPLTMLQMTRVEFGTLTATTKKIINEYCKKAFFLDNNKEYFVKTGVYSNKFDFRNARVIPSEVGELGEYLLFIHNQAVQMAGPLYQPAIYGTATTTEWCVREFIDTDYTTPDFASIRDGNGLATHKHDYIYHGLELRNEIRAFVDFDTKKILGLVQYWDPDTMKHRFNNYSDKDMPTMKHDAIVYEVYEDTLTKRYDETKELIKDKLQTIVDNTDLHGQWSIDIMEKKSVKDYPEMDSDSIDDFYIIDMALATQSAFSDRFKELLRPVEEDWLPMLDTD